MAKGSKRVPMQVVFQGGGAKLCALMAVCDVLKQYHDDGHIQIVRTAGSSAGAIAAVMLASGTPLSTYKARLLAIGKNYVSQMNIHPAQGIWRVYRGNAYFGGIKLDNFFRQLISDDGGPKYVKDLEHRLCESRLYYTDLYSLKSRASEGEELIQNALAKSCRFPLAFSGFRSEDPHVDGGLAMNFPVDDLKKDEVAKGSVIGISFEEEFSNTDSKSLRTYTQRLFSAAIQSGVTRSELILGKENVFKTDTKIGTFDFEKAMHTGLDDDYKLAKSQFTLWLNTWLTDHGPIESELPDYSFSLLRPVVTNAPWRPAVVRELDERLTADPCIHAESVSEFDTAVLDAKGTFSGRYLSRCLMRFRITRKTNVLQFTFQVGKDGSFGGAGYAVTDNSGKRLQFVPHVQKLSDREDTHTYRVFFLFDEPLLPQSPGQPYVLLYEYLADDPFPDLGKKAESLSLCSRQGDSDLVTIVAAFPRAILGSEARHSDVTAIDDEKLTQLGYDGFKSRLVASEPLSGSTCFELLNLPPGSESYVVAGRRAKNVKQNQVVGLVVE